MQCKETVDVIDIEKVTLMLPLKKDLTPSYSKIQTLGDENVQYCSEPARNPICCFFQTGCKCKLGMNSKKGGQCKYLHPKFLELWQILNNRCEKLHPLM